MEEYCSTDRQEEPCREENEQMQNEEPEMNEKKLIEEPKQKNISDLITENILLTDTSQIMGLIRFPSKFQNEYKEYGYKELTLKDLMIQTDEKGKKAYYRTTDGGMYPYDYMQNALKFEKMFNCDLNFLYAKEKPILITFNMQNTDGTKEEWFSLLAIAPRINREE